MADINHEVRPAVSRRFGHIMQMEMLTRKTTPVNSLQGIKSETYSDKDMTSGFSTFGLSTCTAVAGYYLKDAQMRLFLAHISPDITPETLLKQLDLDGVEGVSLDIINGPATKDERNSTLKQKVVDFFHDRRINTHEIPKEQRRYLKAPEGEKVFSYGVMIKAERQNESVTLPVLTTYDEV